MSENSSLHRLLVIVNTARGYGRQVASGIARYAASTGRWLFVHDYHPHTLAQLEGALRRFKPDGLILDHALLPTVELPRLATLRWEIPHAFVLNKAPGLAFSPLLVPDDFMAGRLAARHLRSIRARRFAFLGVANTEFSAERLRGFREELAGHAPEPDVFLLPADWAMLSSSCDVGLNRRLDRWLRGLPKPGALFAVCDEVALLATAKCRSLGIHIPDDLAVMGVDDDDLLCPAAHPHLSSVRMPFENIGWEAARLVDAWKQGQPPVQPHFRMLVPETVTVRESTAQGMVTDAAVKLALAYLDEHFSDRIRVNDLAAHAGLSIASLERRFKNALGITPLLELKRRRLQRAMACLPDPAAPLATIWRQCGFTSYTQFHRAFRETTGLSPGVYRERHARP